MALGSAVAENLQHSVSALLEHNDTLARRVVRGDREINRAQVSIEEDSLTLIARQAPAARDLRFIASVMAIAGELERINDYAKGIANISLGLGAQPLLKPAADFTPMAEKTAEMLLSALEAFLAEDLEAAKRLYAEDDKVDRMYNEIYQQLIRMIAEDSSVMDQATHLLWAVHNLERTGDRICNICERTIFRVTGEMVDTPTEVAEATTT